MKRLLIVIGVAVLLAGIWYAFRPERLFVNAKVNETFPAAGTQAGTTLAAGVFHGVAHETHGTAATFQLPGGNRILRLTDFTTSNGPDVHVYLVAANDAQDNDTVTKAGFVDIGPLKGNIGDQNYDVPSDLDLTKYRSVAIWCKRFGVNFATAPLSQG